MSNFVFQCPKLFTEKELEMDKDSKKYDDSEGLKTDGDGADNGETQVYFPPRVSLPLMEIKSLEEDEELVVQMRARIYRYVVDEEDGPEFKERGTGLLKILYNPDTGAYRIVMRRDITYKVCANHFLLPGMELKYHNNSDKVFIYSTAADLFDGETSSQTFAIRFRTAEIASTFKSAFEESVQSAGEKLKNPKKKDDKKSEESTENESNKAHDDGDHDDAEENKKNDTDDQVDASESEKIVEKGDKDKENKENIEQLSEQFNKKIEI